MRTIKINYKGHSISRTRVFNNINKVLKQANASENIDWYKEANSWCAGVATKYSIPLNKVIGIVSAMSPLKQWDLNKRIALEFITDNKSGHTKCQMNKADEIMANCNADDAFILKTLNGDKTKNFYLNIKYYNNAENLTVDRQAIQVALGRILNDREMNMTSPQYNFFKECYIYTAQRLNMRPSLLQSITWLTWRRIK
jgi:hypothetical protein